MAIDRKPVLDPYRLPSPCYVADLALLRHNLEILAGVRERTGCHILLALKGFAMHGVFPLVSEYLQGVCASSIYEAQLGAEKFGKQVHAYAPAYTERDIKVLQGYADHISFNSFDQWERYRDRLKAGPRPISCGLRINPEHSEVEVALYDPCSPRSRLGITADKFSGRDLSGIEGLHFHALCEQNSDVLERMLASVEAKFGAYLPQMKWVNFGGGHHITRDDYDVELLCRLITGFREKYGVEVYLEPGEAVALNAGFLIAEVLDIVERREGDIAILDTSASAHMPDVLEMPYRPRIEGAGEPGVLAHTYQLAGLSCLAGDVIGDYSFDRPLQVGDRLMFYDMLHYSMVKNTMFNGVQLPAIAVFDPADDQYRVLREFGYLDYASRLS